MYRLLDRPDVLRWVKSQAPDAPICLPDIDGSQSLSVNDVFSFLRQWFQSGVDWNGDLMITVQDLLSFIDEWFTGC